MVEFTYQRIIHLCHILYFLTKLIVKCVPFTTLFKIILGQHFHNALDDGCSMGGQQCTKHNHL